MKRALSLFLCSGLAAQAPVTLASLESLALKNNPSVAQAEAAVRVAEGRARQAGLYPNPVMGANGDEIAGGPIIRGGEIGGFFEQRIVTGGKLRLSRQAAERETAEAVQHAAREKLRVTNTVRMLFYQALGEQNLIGIRTQALDLANEAAWITAQLANTGQADRTDQLGAGIDVQRAEIALIQMRNARERTWRQLAAAVNAPSLNPGPLEGDLETLPVLNIDQALEKIYAENPDVRAAEVNTTRADLLLRRAQREPLPDIQVRGGVRYNRELLEIGPLGGRRPVGREGFFDIGVEIPVFNRNQGNIAAARAEAERARLSVVRTRLSLRARLAEVHREYLDASAATARYKEKMIPLATQSVDLLTKNYQQMAAAYPQVLVARRNLLQLREEYVMALVQAWQRAVEVQGLLVIP